MNHAPQAHSDVDHARAARHHINRAIDHVLAISHARARRQLLATVTELRYQLAQLRALAGLEGDHYAQ